MGSMIYGHNKTIHRTENVNVEIDNNGIVVAVWYRCALLPFTQYVVGVERSKEMKAAYDSGNALPIAAMEFVTDK